jgi:glycine/D-amino acid oxidase-like deaminating enzyme
MFLHYFRTTNDGRVLMGSGQRADRLRGPHRRALLARRADGRRAPRRGCGACFRARRRPRRRAWGGPIDVSVRPLPFFRTRPGTRIHYGAGYSGHGVGPSWLGGQILASAALGADDEWTRSRSRPGCARLPPEPFGA